LQFSHRDQVTYTAFNISAGNGDRAELGYNIFAVHTMLNDTLVDNALKKGTCTLFIVGC